jgi:hypothetical protein
VNRLGRTRSQREFISSFFCARICALSRLIPLLILFFDFVSDLEPFRSFVISIAFTIPRFDESKTELFSRETLRTFVRGEVEIPRLAIVELPRRSSFISLCFGPSGRIHPEESTAALRPSFSSLERSSSDRRKFRHRGGRSGPSRRSLPVRQ